MLPDSSISPKECLPFKFADTAVPALADALHKFKGNGSFISAKIAGGANMFPSMKDNSLNIGAKNVEAVKNALANNKFKLIAEDIGGEHGRRISFNVVTGLVTIRTHNGGFKKL
jgi:chemotaxis protein CheD